MQKCILHIKLVKRPTGLENKIQNQMDNGGLDNQTGNLSVIKTQLLVKALRNKLGLFTFNRAISKMFSL